MTGRMKGFTVGLIGTFAFGVLAIGQQFEINRSTIDGGGVMRSAGGEFELSGTIGQPDAGVMTSADGTIELYGGFWFPLAAGDCDEDGGVTLFDYQPFEVCLTGPVAPRDVGCVCFDLNRNGAIDLLDAALFQLGFSGQ